MRRLDKARSFALSYPRARLAAGLRLSMGPTCGASSTIIIRAVTASPPTVSFAALPAGWRSFPSSGAVATSWQYVPGRGIGGWADHMPRGGIAISVTFLSTKRVEKPLRLVMPASPAAVLDGTTDTPEFRLEGEVHGHAVLVSVDIRSRRLRLAQRILASIRFR